MNTSSEELKIRDFKKNDINKKYLSWLNDKKLLKFSRNKNIVYNYQKSIQYFNTFKKSNNLFFVIIFKKIKIGTATVYFKNKNKIANIGILIGDNSFQNKGFATKIILKLIKRIKIKKELAFFEIGTSIKNLKMIRVAKKCKFKIYKKNSRYVYFKKKI